MEINFEDYLSEEERKEIARHAFKESLNLHLKENHSNIIFNYYYPMVIEMINESFNGELEKLICEKIKISIEGMNFYNVFSAYDKENKALDFFHKAINDNAHIIEERVKVIFLEIEEFNLRRLITSWITAHIEEKLLKEED